MNVRYAARVSAVLAIFGASLIACDDAGPASAEARMMSSRSLPAPAQPAADADETVVNVARAVADGDLHVAWDAMPASWQQDVTEIVHTFATKVDKDVWNKSFDILNKTGAMLANKKDIILAMPKFQQAPDFNLAEANANWPHVVSIFTTIGSSDIADTNKMARMDIRKFLGTTGSAVMSDIIALADVADGADKFREFGNLKATIVSQDGDVAVVRIEADGRTHNEDFVRVEGKWVPADMARDWDKEMNNARRALANFSDEEFQRTKPQVMQMLTMVEGIVDQLNNTQTPEQFEQTMQMAMMQIFGAAMTMSQSMQN